MVKYKLFSEESCIADDGMIIVECKFVEDLPEKIGKLTLVDKRKYGIASVLIYKQEDCEQ